MPESAGDRDGAIPLREEPLLKNRTDAAGPTEIKDRDAAMVAAEAAARVAAGTINNQRKLSKEVYYARI